MLQVWKGLFWTGQFYFAKPRGIRSTYDCATQSIIDMFAFLYFFSGNMEFIRPGLKDTEKKLRVELRISLVSLLFWRGVSFGYFVVSPMAINSLANFKLDESIQNQFDINDYISLFRQWWHWPVDFQLPMISKATCGYWHHHRERISPTCTDCYFDCSCHYYSIARCYFHCYWLQPHCLVWKEISICSLASVNKKKRSWNALCKCLSCELWM